MQAVIFAHTEPTELGQLCVSKSCANLPMGRSNLLSLIINRFLESDISDILITHPPHGSHLAHLEQLISQKKSHWPVYVHVTLCEIPPECTMIDCLSRLRQHLTADYVFLTHTNTVLTDLDLRQPFLHLIRNNSGSVAVFSSLPVKESKLFKSCSRELVVTNQCGAILSAYFGANDVKKHTTLPRVLTSTGCRVTVRTDLKDIGLYLLSRDALETAIRVRDDLPQYKKRSILHLIQPDSSSVRPPSPARSDSSPSVEDLEQTVGFYSLYGKPFGVGVYEHVDTNISLQLYDPLMFVEANRIILQRTAFACTDQAQSGKKEKAPKDYSQIGKDCVIDPKSTICGSLISDGCRIGSNTRIINSVLLPEVIVEQNCVIQNCVLGEKVTTGPQCQLKNCAVAALQRVPMDTVLESEQLGFTDPELEGART